MFERPDSLSSAFFYLTYFQNTFVISNNYYLWANYYKSNYKIMAEKHTEAELRARNDNLHCQVTYWKKEAREARTEAKKQITEKAGLEDAIRKITEVQNIGTKAFENLERQLQQCRESGDAVANDNERLKGYLSSSKQTIDGLTDQSNRIYTQLNDRKNEVDSRDLQIAELKNSVKFWRSVGMFAMCASVLTIIGHILFS